MHPTIGTLMLLADGEASGRAAEDAHRHLEACGACRSSLTEIQAQRALARDAIEASLDPVSFLGFSARVMRAIADERPVGLRERLGVWMREFFAHRRRVWVPGLALATAVVLATLVFGLGSRPGSWPTEGPEMGGSSVVSIRAASSAIVFDIPSADGLSSTAVVWVNDEDTAPGGSGS
jgi:anti-sigma factor RsiW